MKRIACPMALQELYKNITFALTRVLASDGNTQRAFWPIYSSFTIAPRPQAWDTKTFVGGNLLCDVLSPSSKIPGVAFTSAGSCGSSAQEPIVGDTSSLLGALLAVKSINSTTAAQRDVRSPESTLKLLLSSTSFLKSNLPQEDAALLLAQAQPVKAFVYDQLRIYMVQYTIGPPYGFARSRYFDPAESDFELYTWLILFDWVKGLREAVFFEGENGNLTAMSSSMNFNQMPINPMEVPRNVSLYVRRLLQYITLLMLYVACIVSVYIIKLKGQIEAYNMLVFSRVTGLVWVGRPMVIVRALSAICLLATASLSLVRPVEGLVSYFVSTRQPWYKIILTAGELHWLVYVVNDIFSILTDSFTPGYASSSFILVWVSSTMWAFLLPPSSQITLSRDCTIEQVDYQVVCTSGVVEIGQLTQMYGLTALVLSCCFLCYLFERFHSRRIERHSANSLLLYAAAKHQFKWGKWEYKGIWYIDKASAVLTGILTWETSSTLCVFDIKTWRIHTLSRDYQSEPNMPSHLKCSVPLVE
ncbi:hypothetical protein AC1031_011031 [Aphanomyces cochlioides]|nr:hypothetical protein AC1031_011031 [Aphanomyces cochlioides]